MKIPKQELFLVNYDLAVEARLHTWEEDNLSKRMWNKDATVWVPNRNEAALAPELQNRLGWLTLPYEIRHELDSFTTFATEIKDAGFRDVVLLGMGGSSLASEVLMVIFGIAPGYPLLTILDNTDPVSVQVVLNKIDIPRTLFLVSSKSGKTIETIAFFNFFFAEVSRVKPDPGKNFVAITDAGSELEKLAIEKSFRRTFVTPSEVGGRYSVFTAFGLLPAALTGLDINRLVRRAGVMADACVADVSVLRNPALILGAAMGELALAAHDKLTFIASPAISPFTVWVEQLIAESTGKRKVGILPVTNEPLMPVNHYGQDRLFVYLRFEAENNTDLEQLVNALKIARRPVIEITLPDKFDLGAEFFRWQMATAACGALITINPFDQPNVEASKQKTRRLMETYLQTGFIPADTPVLVEDDIELYGQSGQAVTVSQGFANFFKLITPGDFIAIMAFVPPTRAVDSALNELRQKISNRLQFPTTLGYGPRFLHSTGQLYKGGCNKGLFVQITHTPAIDLPIPNQDYTFQTLLTAQSLGDYQIMSERGRRLLRIHFKGDLVVGLRKLAEML